MVSSIIGINSQIKHCTFCRLHETRINAVCGEGKIPSKFMFIAQAPGRIEDQEGKLLIGPSGKVFDELMNHINIKRENIYITNLIKCFLPKCRKPRSDEINTCFELYLRKEIELVKPEIIVTLGYHVSKFVFRQYGLKVPSRIGFRKSFGKLFFSKNRKIVPVRHPATVVHQSKQLSKLIEDYEILRTLKSNCPLISICDHYKEFEKGMIHYDYTGSFCYGNWKICEFFH